MGIWLTIYQYDNKLLSSFLGIVSFSILFIEGKAIELSVVTAILDQLQEFMEEFA